jgi:arylsulfatase A-like enzyme
MRNQLILVVIVWSLLFPATRLLADDRPNVLFIAIDDLNDWVGCLGGHPNAQTPAIDELAKRGTLFTNAHCQAPICGPSRASLLSGRFPHSTGVYQQPTKNRLAADTVNFAGQLLPEYFAKHGYQTLGAGKITHGYPMKQAFQIAGSQFGGSGPKPGDKTVRFNYSPDLTIPFTGTQTDWAAFPDVDQKMPDHKAADWATQQLESIKGDKPFFLAVGFVRPHVPFYAPQKWFDLFPLDTITLPEIPDDDLKDVPEMGRQLHELPRYPQLKWLRENDNEQLRKCVQAYLACTAFVDHQVGRVLQSLEKSRHASNTIVVLFSDHGYHLGEKHRVSKHSLWEESTRVPLIVSRPGNESSATCDLPVGLIDLYPTLLELCGLPAREQNEGVSLVPLLNDPKSDLLNGVRNGILTTYGRSNHSIRTRQFRYISYEDGSEELYDHMSDPHEWTNLANKKAHRTTLIKLRAELPDHEARYHASTRTSPVNAWFQEQFRRSRVQAKDDLEPLFDGKTLDNWTSQNGKPVGPGWEVVDEAIHLSRAKGRAGHIITKREYGDFDLSFEWKIAKGGNSGLKYRVRKYGGQTLGLEYQILGKSGTGKGSTGSLYALFAPHAENTILKPDDEFNLGRIVVLGNQIEHWINGKLIVQASTTSPEWDQNVKNSKFSNKPNFSRNRFGKLMMTDHGAEVWYRNLRIDTENVQLTKTESTSAATEERR